MLDILKSCIPEIATEKKVINAAVLWLFREIDARTFGQTLSRVARRRIVAVKVSAELQKESLIPIKVALLTGKPNEKVPAAELETIFSSITGKTKVFLKKLQRMVKVSSVQEVLTLQWECVQSIDLWLHKFVVRKLRFLRQQRVGLDLDDIKHELLCMAIQGFNLTWPFFHSKLHAVNVLKRTAHNSGINMIKHYTRQKNSALMPNGSVTESRLVSLDVLADVGRDDVIDELRIDFDKALSKYKGTKRRFLRLLRGEYSKEFSAWLNRENDEFFYKVEFKTYLRNLTNWLGVRWSSAIKFLQNLQVHFAAYA